MLWRYFFGGTDLWRYPGICVVDHLSWDSPRYVERENFQNVRICIRVRLISGGTLVPPKHVGVPPVPPVPPTRRVTKQGPDHVGSGPRRSFTTVRDYLSTGSSASNFNTFPSSFSQRFSFAYSRAASTKDTSCSPYAWRCLPPMVFLATSRNSISPLRLT